MAAIKKNSLIYLLAMFLGLTFGSSINLPSISHSQAASNLFSLTQINHNFNFSISTQSNSLGSSTIYSIGDKISYKFSEELSFVGNFNLVTSTSSFNQFENSFTNPELNFDIGLQYNLNDKSNFQLRLIKNTLNPNCNTVAF